MYVKKHLHWRNLPNFKNWSFETVPLSNVTEKLHYFSSVVNALNFFPRGSWCPLVSDSLCLRKTSIPVRRMDAFVKQIPVQRLFFETLNKHLASFMYVLSFFFLFAFLLNSIYSSLDVRNTFVCIFSVFKTSRKHLNLKT